MLCTLLNGHSIELLTSVYDQNLTTYDKNNIYSVHINKFLSKTEPGLLYNVTRAWLVTQNQTTTSLLQVNVFERTIHLSVHSVLCTMVLP